MVSAPPATRTLPLASNVAVCKDRPALRLPVGSNWNGAAAQGWIDTRPVPNNSGSKTATRKIVSHFEVIDGDMFMGIGWLNLVNLLIAVEGFIFMISSVEGLIARNIPMVTETLLSSPVSSKRDRSSMKKQVQHARSNLLETKLLITEVTCDCRSTVTIASGNDFAVGLNEHRVSKGLATTECCADKAR